MVGDVRARGLDEDARPTIYVSPRQSPSTMMTVAVRGTRALPADGSHPRDAAPARPGGRAGPDRGPRRPLEGIARRPAVSHVLPGAVLRHGAPAGGRRRVRDPLARRGAALPGDRNPHGARSAVPRRDPPRRRGRGAGRRLRRPRRRRARARRRESHPLASFGVAPGDPLTVAAAAATVLAAALLAAWLPARRAAKADPVAALRQEGT